MSRVVMPKAPGGTVPIAPGGVFAQTFAPPLRRNFGGICDSLSSFWLSKVGEKLPITGIFRRLDMKSCQFGNRKGRIKGNKSHFRDMSPGPLWILHARARLNFMLTHKRVFAGLYLRACVFFLDPRTGCLGGQSSTA